MNAGAVGSWRLAGHKQAMIKKAAHVFVCELELSASGKSECKEE